MLNLKVFNQNGESIEEITLDESIFGIEPHTQSIFDAVRLHLANRRQATSKTKKRNEVRGGGKKPWRQKGTGRARHGSIRSPQWRGGGVVFGPSGERNYTLKQNRKERDLALKSALSLRVKEEAFVVVDKFDFEKPSTKQMAISLEKLPTKGKTLIVATFDTLSENAMLSAYNLPTVGFIGYDQINTYDLMNCDTLIFTKEAVEVITEVLADGQN